MAFTTSGQEMEWALFLQPRSPHGALQVGQICIRSITACEEYCRIRSKGTPQCITDSDDLKH